MVQNDLTIYSEYSHEWWIPGAPRFRSLQNLTPFRLNLIREFVGDLSGKTVLDVGCGGGLLSEGMAARGAIVTGIDLSEKPLGVARLHLLESGQKVDYRKISVEQLATEMPGAFDAVTCLEMLEHVPDPASVVASCARLVKPGGQVFLSTLNRNPKAYLFAVIGAEYVLQMLPKGTHDFARFIKPSELTRWCRQSGLETDELIGMTYNPLTRRYALERDTSVNYLIRATRNA